MAFRAAPDRAIARRRMRAQLLEGSPEATPAGVVAHLTVVQAQEPAYARWSVAQRTAGTPAATAFDAAFDQGLILRTHVLRPTWHYVAPSDLRWLMALSGPRVDAANARRYRSLGLDNRTLNRSNQAIAEAVDGRPHTRAELAAILEAGGIATSGERTTYMLMHAELTSVICSGPMRAKLHTYASFDRRVPPGPAYDRDEAVPLLAWRYFSTRGPATVEDFSWWSGLPIRVARHGLEAVQLRLNQLTEEGRTYWFAGAAGPQWRRPRIELIARYDELVLSYRQTRNILHTSSASFPLLAHIDGYHHILVLDGQLLGHWRARSHAHGEHVETRSARKLDDEERHALERAIDRYTKFIR